MIDSAPLAPLSVIVVDSHEDSRAMYQALLQVTGWDPSLWLPRATQALDSGKTFARSHVMDAEHVPYRIIRGRGRIEAGQFSSDANYELHLDASGRPVFVQFDEHPDDLADGATVRLALDDGRVLHCQVLGDTPLCSVITVVTQ
jgi:hypothetical protein